MIIRAAQVRGAIAEAAWPAPPRVQRSSDRHGATDLAGVAAGSEANQRLQRGSAGSVALHSGGAWRGMRALTAVQRLGPRVQEPRRLVEQGLARLERDVVGPARMVEDPQRPRRIALALPDVDDDLLTLTAS